MNVIHNNFTKLYYRGVMIKMKYGDKAREKLFPEFYIQENKKEEKKEENKKEEKKEEKIEVEKDGQKRRKNKKI